MWRWTRRVLVTLIGLTLLTMLAGATYEWAAARRAMAATPPPGRLVDIGGYRLHLWCTGAGSPLVILESGLGGSAANWGYVQPEVARFTRVCSYDRAGLGYSDPGPSPRTAGRIARELRDLLDRSGVSEPLVLVGASSGGFSVRLFASAHPERVAGLVLVDASHEDQGHEVPSIAFIAPLLASIGAFRLFGVSFDIDPASFAPPVRSYAHATQFRAAGFRAAASEIRSIETTANEVRTGRRPLTQPLVVLTGGRGADARWRALQRDLATLSSRGCQTVAEESGHRIAFDEPQIVIDSIRTVVDAARQGSEGPVCGRTRTP